MEFDYPMDFAAGLWKSIESPLVVIARSTFDDFVEDSENWFAQEYEGKRHKYTINEMMANWRVLEIQKFRVLCYWWIEQGKARSLEDAQQKLHNYVIYLYPERFN